MSANLERFKGLFSAASSLSQVGTQEGCTGDEDDVTSGLNGEGRAVISIEIRATKSGWHALSAVDDSLHGVEETKRRNTMMLITLAKQY